MENDESRVEKMRCTWAIDGRDGRLAKLGRFRLLRQATIGGNPAMVSEARCSLYGNDARDDLASEKVDQIAVGNKDDMMWSEGRHETFW
jgi:hypothetical protein